MLANIKRAEALADVIEVRFDCLRGDQIENFKSQISNLKCAKPLLATFRSPEEGGNREMSLDERRAFWGEQQDSFWAADLEEDVISGVGNYSAKIVSFHDFDGVPDNIDQIFDRLSRTGAEIIKIAVTANDITDAIPVWKLLDRAKAVDKKMISIAMGKAGKWTRILGLAHGAYLTYASLGAGKETADGQLNARDLAVSCFFALIERSIR